MADIGTMARQVGRFLGSWVVAAVVTTALAVFFQTQNLISRLNGLGADIGLAERLSTSAYDIFRLGSLYILFIAAGTLIAFLVGALVYRLAGFGRPIVYAVAGAVAMIVMLTFMKHAFFGVQLIGGARDTVGLIMQMVAGGLGGWLFATLSAAKRF